MGVSKGFIRDIIFSLSLSLAAFFTCPSLSLLCSVRSVCFLGKEKPQFGSFYFFRSCSWEVFGASSWVCQRLKGGGVRKMEGRKQMGSSSFPSELFGSNQSQKSSASGIFESMFSPPSKVLGRESLRTEVSDKTTSDGWSSKVGTYGYNSKGNDGETRSTGHNDMSSIYQDQRVQPCHLSSSIYYGGQDIYSRPKSTHDSGLNCLFKTDGVEDDSGSASRGNWWQGSLYY